VCVSTALKALPRKSFKDTVTVVAVPDRLGSRRHAFPPMVASRDSSFTQEQVVRRISLLRGSGPATYNSLVNYAAINALSRR